ncbi:16S rRNA (cytosine(1402)-N(4))-methyltransferase RsmH [Francisella frigiditurris]|uniref:Ribosomal RNA small subunit methyltransferase H n=1 Tax=Francisella frigiditurris TaxID=1542390 RepID=A0A1J0KVG4_9GAMM|nr:16S rRNA (cytosine(1402)-N(4))-methyltransferase RsmH [Francisella frigiditurris]APC97604.1 16S rRNA (cytosine(1402)-N(4))-methyltransferase [Francisella frigiditurris]
MHFSVLLKESIDGLDIKKDGIYIDATFGRGGHSKAILDKLSNTGKLIAFDKDLEAINYAKTNFSQYLNFEIIHSSFTEIYDYCLKENLLERIDGIIMDLGVSSPQLDVAERGFSFMHDGPLDMRMDNTKGITASEALEQLDIKELSYIFKVYGEEKFSYKIAIKIKEYLKQNGKITNTLTLANLIRDTIGKKEKKNPATRCFQALRIYVNNELGDLEQLINDIMKVLKSNGRVAAISFHSLEDRIIKQKFTELSKPKTINTRISKFLPEDDNSIEVKWINKKCRAQLDELEQNARSRSAILRVVEKL